MPCSSNIYLIVELAESNIQMEVYNTKTQAQPLNIMLQLFQHDGVSMTYLGLALSNIQLQSIGQHCVRSINHMLNTGATISSAIYHTNTRSTSI